MTAQEEEKDMPTATPGGEKRKAAAAVKSNASVLFSLVSTFLSALIVLLIVCAYYAYRLSQEEVGSRDFTGPRGNGESSPGSVRTDAKASVNLLYQYTRGEYGELQPNVPLVNETVLNPQLMMRYTLAELQEMAARLAKEREGHEEARGAGGGGMAGTADGRVAAAVLSTSPSRRYVLTNIGLRQRYMLRLSYLGSPSVSYGLYLYHIRASTLQREKVRRSSALAGGGGGGGEGQDNPALSSSHRTEVSKEKMPSGLAEFVPMDTEVITITTHHRYASQFAEDETIMYDGADLQRRAEEEEEEERLRQGGEQMERERGVAEDPFVAVLEVLPSTLSFAEDPRDFPVLSYNLQLSPLALNLVPDVTLPLISAFSLIVVAFGRKVIYRWLINAVIASAEVEEAEKTE